MSEVIDLTKRKKDLKQLQEELSLDTLRIGFAIKKIQEVHQHLITVQTRDVSKLTNMLAQIHDLLYDLYEKH
jgi:hypothetical protein